MNRSKAWFNSRAIWGGIICLATAIGQLIGHAEITSAQMVNTLNNIAAALTAIGAILAIIGRLRATKTIGSAQ